MVWTKVPQPLWNSWESVFWFIGFQLFDNLATMYPMCRIEDPSEVAQSIVFLASNAASFITGVNLPITGGLDITMMQPRDGWP